MATKVKSKPQTGLAIKRNNNAFTLTWKLGDKDYGDGQTCRFRCNKEKFADIAVGKATTQKTATVDLTRFYPTTSKTLTSVQFALRGNRKAYMSKRKRIDPSVSEWVYMGFAINKPGRPTVTATLSDQYENVCTFNISYTGVSTTNHVISTDIQYQSMLVKNCTVTDGSKLEWKSNALGYMTGTKGTSGGTVTITEQTELLAAASYTRWFRARVRGAGGASDWAYSKHVYARPYAAKISTATAKATASGGYMCTVEWTAGTDAAHPIDLTTVQYALAVPDINMACPDGASWADASTTRDTGGKDSATFSVDSVVGTDQCLFVRVNTKHDSNITYGAAKAAAVGRLADPSGLSVATNATTYRATVTCTNNSSVEDSFLDVRYVTASNPNGFCCGIIPNGQTSVSVQCPDWSSEDSFGFKVRAVVGTYTATPREDGVSSYAVTAKMHSTHWAEYGGTVPQAPGNVALSMTDVPGTVQVTFDWTWDEADAAELSWADHPDAWQSTDEPETYLIDNTHASLWNISGLETGVTWYVRVRLVKGKADSATYGTYSDIQSIDLSSTPVTPVLAMSAGIVKEGAPLTASWIYVSTDGTLQSYAEVAEVDGTDYTVIAAVQTAQSVEIDTSGWATGEEHSLVVRVYSDSGRVTDWSDPYTVIVAEPLVCRITQTSLGTESENLISYPYQSTAGTYNGITVTISDDGYVTVTGTATANLSFRLQGWTISNGAIPINPDETYVLEGCPSGGSTSTYCLSTRAYAEGITPNSNTGVIRRDTGEGVTLTGFAYVSPYITIFSGQTVDNLTFHPVLRVSDDITNVLTALPLTVTVTGAGEGVTGVVVERAEAYHVERPDETDRHGFEGETVFIASQTGEGQMTITLDDLIQTFDDGAEYRLIATVQDGMGQSAEASIMFTCHWANQANAPGGTATIDADNLAAMITPVAPATTYTGDTCDIYRLSVDRPVLIYKGATFGETYVDPYPTIGEYGGYRLVTVTADGDYTASDGTMAWIDIEAGVDTANNIIDFEYGRVLAKWEPDVSNKWSKDFKEVKYLGGSVQGYWNAAVSRTTSIGSVAVSYQDQDTIEIMRRLAVYPGVCHVRTKDGSSYAADVQVSESYTVQNLNKLANFSLSATRVESERYDGMTLSEWESTHQEE